MQLFLLGAIIFSAVPFITALPSGSEGGSPSVRAKKGDVKFIHEKTIPKLSEALPEDGSYWYLDQLDGKRDNKYTYPEQAGEGVDIYVIDSGVNVDHEIFGGRAVMTSESDPNTKIRDLAGHGTAVAGVAAKVAKKSKIIGISMGASLSDSAAAIRFAVQQIKSAKKEAKSVINLSFGILSIDSGLDAAVREATDAGIPVVIAAGNDRVDSCIGSPNNVLSAILVSNVKRDHTLAESSQFGSCVDIGAYGTDLKSAGIANSTDYKLVTGTSFAAPLVSGLVAILLSMGIQPVDIRSKLRGLSSPNTVIKGLIQPLKPIDDTNPVLSTTTPRLATLELMDLLK
ncbi:peptidase S8/S53 domain-containing protein [Paraphysoderma sedebokerense]|nr:peptidase S8/S53 domain-containing protein [Paraphysoderma sedebokerense]